MNYCLSISEKLHKRVKKQEISNTYYVNIFLYFYQDPNSKLKYFTKLSWIDYTSDICKLSLY